MLNRLQLLSENDQVGEVKICSKSHEENAGIQVVVCYEFFFNSLPILVRRESQEYFQDVLLVTLSSVVSVE